MDDIYSGTNAGSDYVVFWSSIYADGENLDVELDGVIGSFSAGGGNDTLRIFAVRSADTSGIAFNMGSGDDLVIMDDPGYYTTLDRPSLKLTSAITSSTAVRGQTPIHSKT